jgi:hypothetical protein
MSDLIVRVSRGPHYLQLTSPDPPRWVVDQTLSEITLHTTNKVVIFGMGTLTGKN